MGERTKATLFVATFFMVLFTARIAARRYLSQPIPRVTPVEAAPQAANFDAPPPPTVHLVTVSCGQAACGSLACGDTPCGGSECACAADATRIMGTGGDTFGWSALVTSGGKTVTLSPGTGTLTLTTPNAEAVLVVLPVGGAGAPAVAGAWSGLSPGRYGVTGGATFGWIGPVDLAEGESRSVPSPPVGGAAVQVTGAEGFVAIPVGAGWGGAPTPLDEDGRGTIIVPNGARVWITDTDGHGCIATPTAGSATCVPSDDGSGLPWTPAAPQATPP